jgi:hypothetical protein
MDHYTAEKLYLERGRRVAEAAERRARLRPASARRPARTWLAWRLRRLADRLDHPGCSAWSSA